MLQICTTAFNEALFVVVVVVVVVVHEFACTVTKF
jgi:hypothetical protein